MFSFDLFYAIDNGAETGGFTPNDEQFVLLVLFSNLPLRLIHFLMAILVVASTTAATTITTAAALFHSKFLN